MRIFVARHHLAVLPSALMKAVLLVLLPPMINLLLLPVPRVFSVQMENDLNGFEGIPWGAAFEESPDLVVVESTPRIKGYELKQGPPPLGGTAVDSMRFLTIDGKFARVVVRYHGQRTHEQIVSYLEATFGPLDRTPGQLAEARIHQFNWHGPDTQINLTYEKKTERGMIFFESRQLASAFVEGAGGT